MQFLSIGDWDIIRSLCAFLCNLIYRFIAFLYELFINISRVEILTSKDIQPIYQRITMILAIVMVFYVTFEFVKFVIEPDGIGDKEKGAGKIVYKMLAVVLLIAFVPKIFTAAYDIQNKIFDSQLLSKVILGKQNVDTDSFGRKFSANLFSIFYYIDEDIDWVKSESQRECENISCSQVVALNLQTLSEQGELPYIYVGLNEEGKAKINEGGLEEEVKMKYISFDGLFAVIVGGFTAYMLLLYCIDAGVRVAQIAFLQIIAPIPIIGFLSPKKDGIFQKWCKQCLTTYLDLFLRLAIVYFVLLICEILGNAYHNGTIINIANADSMSKTMITFVYIALIMGLLLFANKAPKMLGELFPKTGSAAASGKFGLKAGERVAPMAARAIGAGLGGTRFVGGAIARGRARYLRNKENGARSVLSKEGREQWRNRRNNRQSSVDRNSEYQAAKKIETTKKNLLDAKAELQKAKDIKDEKRIQVAQNKFDKAASDYRKALKLRGDSQEFKNIQNSRVHAAKNRKAAEEELKEAIASGERTRIDNAQKRFNDATAKEKQEISKFKQFNDGRWDVNQAFARAEEAKSQVTQDKNEKYRSTIGATTWGALAGGFTGATTGAKATKLEEIGSKVKEGKNKDIQNIQSIEKYYDTGGTGVVDRTISKIEKSIGLPTTAEQYTRTIKNIDDQIKINERLSKIETATNKDIGDGENRGNSKIENGELKNKISYDGIEEGDQIKTSTGLISAKELEGKTVSQVYSEYKAKRVRAESEADAAAKRLNELETSSTATESEKQNARTIAEELSAKAETARLDEAKVKKTAVRYAYTQILQSSDPLHDTNKGFEPVMVQKVLNAKNTIKESLRNAETVAQMKLELKKPEDFIAYINNTFTGYDQLDRINSALLNIAAERQRENAGLRGTKERIEASDAYYAAKANDDAASGGKK